MTPGQHTFFSLFDEMDVKGTLSGKQRIFHPDGRPCDALGYMLQRLGYTLVPGSNGKELGSQSKDPDGRIGNSYSQAASALNIDTVNLRLIWNEIDRHASTNESIRALAKRICQI